MPPFSFSDYYRMIRERVQALDQHQRIGLGICFIIIFIGSGVAYYFHMKPYWLERDTYARTQALYKNGKYSEALPLLTDANKKGAKNKETLMRLATSYFQTKEYQKALDAYKAVLVVDSSSGFAYTGLGNCYRELAKTSKEPEKKAYLTQAELNYKTSIQVENSYEEGYLDLANLLLERGDKKAASAVLSNGLKYNTSSAVLAKRIKELQ